MKMLPFRSTLRALLLGVTAQVGSVAAAHAILGSVARGVRKACERCLRPRCGHEAADVGENGGTQAKKKALDDLVERFERQEQQKNQLQVERETLWEEQLRKVRPGEEQRGLIEGDPVEEIIKPVEQSDSEGPPEDEVDQVPVPARRRVFYTGNI
ncbi:unnamed protein product [Amoebophrya sp. A25]|nr:unnamed protein product [Amoebophrya sp. A25]|eukprot:GSA25T00023174001.1